MTLFEKFDDSLNDELIEDLKSLGDRNLGDTKGAIYAIFYTLLAGLIRRANSDMSTNMLVNQIKKIYDKNLKEFDIKDGFSSMKSLTDFVHVGERNMSQIFPSFKSQLLNLVIAHSGTSKGETAKYAGFVNSIIIKLLAEKLNQDSGKDELMNYLKEHRDPLFEKAPESLVEKMIPALGMHDLRNMKMQYARKKEEKERREIKANDDSDEATTPEEEIAEYEYEERSSFPKKGLIIGGVVILVALLAYFLYESREELFEASVHSESSIVDLPVAETLVDSLSTVNNEDSQDAGWLAIKELLTSESLNSDSEIKVESLSFVADSIDLANPANPIIDSLATVFTGNPRLQIQIKGGHANGNSQIAIRRAFSLKRILQSKGVDPVKIDAVSDAENLDYLKIRLISK